MIKFDIKYVSQQGSILTATLLVTNALSLLVPLLFHECATTAAYGLFQYTNVLAGLIGISSLLGMNNAILVAAAQGRDHVLRTASRMRVKTSLLIGCPALFATGLVFARIGGEFTDISLACFLLLPFFPIIFSFMGAYSYLNGKRRFAELAAAQILYSVGNIGLICICLGYFPEWIYLPAVASLALKGLFELAVYISLVRREKIGFAADEHDRKIIAYGIKMSFIRVVGAIHARLDRFIVGSVFGFGDLGSFGAGRAVVVPLREMMILYPRLYIPKLARRGKHQALRSTYKALAAGLLGALPVLAVLILAVPWAYDLLLSRFEGSSTYARLFVVVVFLSLPFYFFYGFFQSQIMARREFVVRLTNAVLVLALMLVLMRFFGLMGLIYAQMIGSVALSLHSWFEARRSVYSNGSDQA